MVAIAGNNYGIKQARGVGYYLNPDNIEPGDEEKDEASLISRSLGSLSSMSDDELLDLHYELGQQRERDPDAYQAALLRVARVLQRRGFDPAEKDEDTGIASVAQVDKPLGLIGRKYPMHNCPEDDEACERSSRRARRLPPLPRHELLRQPRQLAEFQLLLLVELHFLLGALAPLLLLLVSYEPFLSHTRLLP